MMGGTVIFTYKRRRFSNKPHKIEELQPDPSSKPQVEELINKSKSQIDSQKADQPKIELHKIETQTELCKTDEIQVELQNIYKPLEERKVEQSETELCPVDEPETESQIELQKIKETQIELHTEPQIQFECPFKPDNIEEPRNAAHQIDAPHAELQKEDEPEIEPQKVDKSQIEPQNIEESRSEPQSIGEQQFIQPKICEPQLEQEIRDQTQLEAEKVGDEPQADPSAKPQIQESLNKTEEFENEPQKVHKLQSGVSAEPPVADSLDELDSKLVSETCTERLDGDYMEVDNGEDGACGFTISTSGAPIDPDSGNQEMTAGLPNSDQTKDLILPNEEKLSFDKNKPTLKSRQVRTEIDLTKLPMEAELDTEMEALPPESIAGCWMDKEVQWLESLDKDLKAKDKQIKVEKVNFDIGLAPDMLSLRRNFDQDISSTFRGQTRSEPLSAGTNIFGLPLPTSTMDPKGKKVKPIATRDFFASPGTRGSFENTHKQVLENIYTGSRILQEKLRYNNRNNNPYSTDSTYGACSYKLHDWSEEELDFLWIGVRRYGANNWEAVLRDPRLRFTKFKTVEDLAARWEVEQRRLFSCSLPLPVTLPPPRSAHWYNNLETERPTGDLYLDGSSYTAYYSSPTRFWHHSVGTGRMPMPDMMPPHRRRAKYQIRRALKAQTVTHTASPLKSNQPSDNINNSTRDTELPHWLKETVEAPLGLTGETGFSSKELLNRGAVKRKGMSDVVFSEPSIEPDFKSSSKPSFDLIEKKSAAPSNLVVIDSDGASSEETLSA